MEIKQVGVVGAGAMGNGIAHVLSAAGMTWPYAMLGSAFWGKL